MPETWPGTVPEEELAGTFTEEIEDNRATFGPEVGPPKLRRRSSVPTAVLSWEQHLTAAQFAALRTFYETTLQDGVLTFTRTHPRTGASGTFRFTGPPQSRNVAGIDLYRVTFSVREQP